MFEKGTRGKFLYFSSFQKKLNGLKWLNQLTAKKSYQGL